ncbi:MULTISPECIES: MFS transporter [Brevibacterium]|uniref:Major facilitator superfamily multidrug resistance protein n=2 Tax=Brevibacterium casei TaxID=33889 RepID=K9AWL9_9MICO|nr:MULTISPECIES: MFS transporter [Brevibacterium]NJE65346.1 MFS transporter [Brevibacterium sp. LS14]EKU46927.1 major facilitator superfamily multidrug resistance protein [Brevibacterium casei S18]MBE4695255.1 MFS transporter [Brevibacterium casei]MBY3578377.1 MFS transporter [Brevibacterium casei]MCM1012060.1 MFS transporter [Brevibacterium sp. XM4083]
MAATPSSSRAWFTGLVIHTVLAHATYNGVRVLISYRTLELGGTGVVLGLMTACYSLVPLLTALFVGRLVDRGYATAVLWVGTVLSIAPVALAAVAPNLGVLLVATMSLGFGQLLTTVASQALIPQSFPASRLTAKFGHLTLGVSIGQTIGLPLAGMIADATGGSPHIVGALWFMTAFSALTLIAAVIVMLRGRTPHVSRAEAAETVRTPWALLRIRGMKPAILASMATLAAVDLMTAYLPLIGQENGLSVTTVTWLLALRTFASVISRMIIGMLANRWGSLSLLWTASATAGVCVILIPILTQTWTLAILLAIAGFCFGLTQPLTMTWVSTLSDPANRAAVLSIRLAGNRLSQVAIPSLASVLTIVAGSGIVFTISGALLLLAGGVTWRNSHEKW